MDHDFDIIVVGAGVIGLAIGRALARTGYETIVLEREAAFGTHTSSRNSEVVHAGIYYPTNSLKARFCVEGRRKLYKFSEMHGVTFRKYGKVISTSREQDLGRLHAIYQQGLVNGVEGLEILDGHEVQGKVPEICSVGGIWSPETGVINSHQLMLSLVGDFEDAGGSIAYRAPVLKSQRVNDCHRVTVDDKDQTQLTARIIINCAGLWSTYVAQSMQEMEKHFIPKPRYAKGAYFSYAAPTQFQHLVYPLPFVGGLGIHLTLDVSGAAKFGPDVEWFDQIPDYNVQGLSKSKFLQAIREYWPGVDPDRLVPAYSGIRPKLCWADGNEEDFVISGPETHGIEGAYHMFGFESPGLTSCLAIADYVCEQVEAELKG